MMKVLNFSDLLCPQKLKLLSALIEEDCHLYDVQYIVLNGKEEKIHERFVKLHVEESGQRSVRGRCR